MIVELQPETRRELARIPKGTVAEDDAQYGQRYQEPLLVAFDAMLRYAKAYRKAYDGPLGDDSFLGPLFSDVIRGLRGLLNGQGAAAMETGRGTDSKDNSMLEHLFERICDIAGLEADG